MNLLEELNDAQRAAVEQIDGPSLIVAGAGSGKTRVLTYKIAYMLTKGIKPYRIMALTFTNKAAREMRERISKLVDHNMARQLHMGTFHSIFSRILRYEAEVIGYTRDYSIYDATDSKSLIKTIIKDLHLDDKVYKPSAVHARISMAKNHLLSPLDYSRNTDLQKEDAAQRMFRVAEIYSEYNRRLVAANAMDFDDLLVNAYRLFAEHQEVKEKYQRIIKYILVDEYQDTNHVQYLLINLLAEKHHNICVVGDDAQSIYSFRGANIENILSFQKDYSESKLFKLEQNYRSTQNIVDAANSVIHKNRRQIHKDVYSLNQKGSCVTVCALESDRGEAKYVASRLIAHHRKDNISYDEIAVLYRTNAQSRVFEDELRRQGVPYRIYGGVAFYQRKEVKDVLSYMRLALNLKDNEALRRIINNPTRGIGDVTVKKIQDKALEQNCSMMEILCDPMRYNFTISGATAKRLVEFREMILKFHAKVENTLASVLAKDIIETTGLLRQAQLDTSAEGHDRLENLMELLSSIKELETRELEADSTAEVHLADFLAEVSLLTDQDENPKDTEERVTLMTIHAAKGLEFEVVFVTGLETKLFPSAFALTDHEIEEERRLFYVAITRAKQFCYITRAKMRFRNGEMQFGAESIFLQDIDHHYVTIEDGSSTSTGSSSMPQQQKWGGWKQYQHDAWQSKQASTPAKETLRSINETSHSVKDASQSIYKKGMRVRHDKFGAGTVMDAYQENGNEKLEVDFDLSGRKTLLLKFAKITLI